MPYLILKQVCFTLFLLFRFVWYRAAIKSRLSRHFVSRRTSNSRRVCVIQSTQRLSMIDLTQPSLQISIGLTSESVTYSLAKQHGMRSSMQTEHLASEDASCSVWSILSRSYPCKKRTWWYPTQRGNCPNGSLEPHSLDAIKRGKTG